MDWRPKLHQSTLKKHPTKRHEEDGPFFLPQIDACLSTKCGQGVDVIQTGDNVVQTATMMRNR